MSFASSLLFIRTTLISVAFTLGVASAAASTDAELSERQKA